MATENKSIFDYPMDVRYTPDERLIALLKTWNPITIQDDAEYNNKLVWCLENCQDKFRDICYFDTRVWYFQNEKDAAMFALRWG
jgi:hypothetical protein